MTSCSWRVWLHFLLGGKSFLCGVDMFLYSHII